MVFFIKGNENIFHAKRRLPENFVFGLLLNLFYSMVLLLVAFMVFKRKMFPASEKPSAYETLKLELNSGEMRFYYHFTPELSEQFYNALLGNKRFQSLNWPFTFNGEALKPGVIKDFLYIPNIDQIPGEIKVGSLVSYFKGNSLSDADYREIIGPFEGLFSKRFDQLKTEQKLGVLVSLAELRKDELSVLFFNDFYRGIGPDKKGDLVERVERLSGQGVLVIDLSFDNKNWLLIEDVRMIFDYTKGFRLSPTEKVV